MRLLWRYRFMRAARRNGGRSICLCCFLPLTFGEDSAHVLEVNDHLRIEALCIVCNYKLCQDGKIRYYKLWLKYLSGLPVKMWGDVINAVIKDDEECGL